MSRPASARVYCYVCEEVNNGDEDGFCLKCGDDNVFSFDADKVDAEIENAQSSACPNVIGGEK